MKTIFPSYYRAFTCLAGVCKHTCCVGWEIDVDADSLPRFLADKDIAPHVDCTAETPHFRLLPGERCPFLREDGLCSLILEKGEETLCQICRDHPRFRNFWSDRTELGLGLVCEEAARLILSQEEPMRLEVLSEDGAAEEQPAIEAWLLALREEQWAAIRETGPRARLKEYLLYRHLPGALDDGLVEERLRFIEDAYREITAAWDKTDGSLPALVECARAWSYDVEYDDEVIDARLAAYEKSDDTPE